MQPNFVSYLGLVNAIKELNHNVNVKPNQKLVTMPILMSNVVFFFKFKKGAKNMYNILIHSNKAIPTGRLKWTNIFNYLGDKEWSIIFQTPFISTKDTKIKWFQTRLNHNILGTNSLLNKIDNSHSNKCSFCKTNEETIEHLLWECSKTQTLIYEFENYLQGKNIFLDFNKASFLLGYHSNRRINIPNNNVLMWIKYYIYKSKMQDSVLTLPSLINHMKTYFLQAKSSALMTNEKDSFLDQWKHISKLFEE